MKIGSFILVAIGAFMAGAYYHENKNTIKNKISGKLDDMRSPQIEEEPTNLSASLPSDPPTWTPGELH